MYSALLREQQLLAALFAFLDDARPLDTTRAGYFARVVLSLLQRRAPELLAFLEAHPRMLECMVDHVDTTSIAEVAPPPQAASILRTQATGHSWRLQSLM